MALSESSAEAAAFGTDSSRGGSSDMAANKGSSSNAYGGRSKTFKKSKTDVQYDDNDEYSSSLILWSQNDRMVFVEFPLTQRQRESMVDAIMYDDIEQSGSILVLTVNGYEFWKYRLGNPVKGSLQLTKSVCGTKACVTLTKSNVGEEWMSLGELLFEEDYALSPSVQRSLAYREIKFLKDDFYNKDGAVSYVAYVEDLRRESVHVTFNPSSFSFIFSTTCQKFLGMYQPATSSTVFYRHVKTRHNYDHSASSFRTTSRTIEITLVKHNNTLWSSVEAPVASESVVPASTSPMVTEGLLPKDSSCSPAALSSAASSSSELPRSQQRAARAGRLAADTGPPRERSGQGPGDDDNDDDGGRRRRRQRVADDGAGDSLPSFDVAGGDYGGSGHVVVGIPDLAESGAVQQPVLVGRGQPGREQLYAGDGSGLGSTASSAASSASPTSPLQPGKPTCVVQPLKDADAAGDPAKPGASAAAASSLPSMSTLYAAPFRGTRFTGLENLGNTCFMNSILQVLASTVEFRDYFLYGLFEQDINRDNPLGTGGRLATAFAELMRCLWKGDRPSYAPSKLKSVITAKAAQFTGYAQHDAQEFLAFLLDGLHEDLNKVKNKPYVPSADPDGKCDEELSREAWDAHKRRNDSLVVDAFQAQYKSKLVCPECAKVSITFDPYMYLSVPLPRKKVRVPVFVNRRQPVSKPVKYVLALPGECTTDHVLRELSEISGIPTANLRLFEVHKRRFVKFYDASMPFSVTTGTEDHVLFASEVLTRESAGERVLELRVTQCASMPTETATLRCASCRREPGKLRRCTRCLKVGYCNSDCQRKHWDATHRHQCRQGPEHIGLPFIISVQESRATYQCIAQMMEQYAQYSVNVFQRLQSKPQAIVASSPTSLTTVTTASSEPALAPHSDLPGTRGGSPGAGSLGSGDRSRSSDDCRSSSCDTADLAGGLTLGGNDLAQATEDGRRGTVTFVIGDSVLPRTEDGHSFDGTVTEDLDDYVRGSESSAAAGDTFLPAAAAASPASGAVHSSDAVQEPQRDGSAWGQRDGSPDRHGDNDCGVAGAASGGPPSLPASPCSPPSVPCSASQWPLSTPPPGLLVAAPSPSSPQTSSKDTGDESQPTSPEADLAMQPPTSPRSKPTHPVVGVANAEAGACGSRRTFPFSIKQSTTGALAPATSAPLKDEGDRPLRFTGQLLSRSSPHYLTMEWQNDDHSSDGYVLLNSKNLDHELDASCTAVVKDDLTLEQCLQLFTEPERLTPEDAWYCPSCKQHREATKQLSLWSLPDILIIHLKRFSFQNLMWRNKMDKLVEYPIRGLDLSQYCVGPPLSDPPLYDLFGVVNHYGALTAGHYTAYARCVEDGSAAAPYGSEQGWRLFDDSSVTHIAEKCIVSADAYVLFYRKRKSAGAVHPTAAATSAAPTLVLPGSRGFGDGRHRQAAGGSSSAPLSSSESGDDDDDDGGRVTAAATACPSLFTSSSSSHRAAGSGDGGFGPGNTDMEELD